MSKMKKIIGSIGIGIATLLLLTTFWVTLILI